MYVFEESLVWSMILQQIPHTYTEEACEDRLADDKLQLKHTSAGNKSDMNKNKCNEIIGITDQQKA